jgi:predicted HD phosphohydrolase
VKAILVFVHDQLVGFVVNEQGEQRLIPYRLHVHGKRLVSDRDPFIVLNR